VAQPLIAPMPKDLDLGGGFVLRITAVDPTTGAQVTGVKVSNVVMTVDPISGAIEPPVTPGDLNAPSPYLVPTSGG
jgi:hypothetical protein